MAEHWLKYRPKDVRSDGGRGRRRSPWGGGRSRSGGRKFCFFHVRLPLELKNFAVGEAVGVAVGVAVRLRHPLLLDLPFNAERQNWSGAFNLLGIDGMQCFHRSVA